MKTKVLIIEDNEQNMYLLTFILEKNDFEVVQARDGKAGIEIAKNDQNLDLILTDIQLPVMDGYTVVREILKIPDRKTIPIIAITSYAMSGDREKAMEAGCSGYITKPINPETFIATIRQFMPAEKKEKE